MKLFSARTEILCSRFIFSATSFGGLVMVIINYHKDLVLQWFKGSEQLLWM